ncbi:hypothetical protein [Zongyangia hominis]|uniref:Uncharacterized protein n=1 Tax=Zongyangia hominis TaxID=2763677 RepID=A0A926I740_9FIRM|nr:hypothetical protein [Zongyangia hominis]MBC8570689.1 hypothetical protein [Zongyangia hominis]
MKNLAQKLALGGISLLLFGLLLAVMTQTPLSYVVGGLGLVFSLTACITQE